MTADASPEPPDLPRFATRAGRGAGTPFRRGPADTGHALVSAADRLPSADADRLQADARVVEVLRADGFTGARYRRFTAVLMEYGWPIMVAWNINGDSFRRTWEIGRPIPRRLIITPWDEDDCFEVATDTVLKGLELFRSHALLGGAWNQHGGAALTTYYVGACIRAFKPVYVQWSRAQLHGRDARLPIEPGGPDPLSELPDARAEDPERQVVLQDEITRLLPYFTDGQLRQGIAWRALGYSQAEAAELSGMTPKALERRLSRARSRIARHTGRGKDDSR
ncbi:hypothetical protein [Streptomyces sp. DSM 40907]|uniref:hypothetical protein n=1 Tax=Streptomyces kutzneri TaxID=3051179 RepID=UPI0028D021AB|nr:hypothetical protein [Streptomyces sp. DSM 40907]